MNWTEKCMLDLDHHKLFENDAHRRRFYDLMSCYFSKPFFSKGLCKSMYLASWDADHFMMMLETLNSTLIERDFRLSLMRDQGLIWQKQAHDAHDIEQEEIWKLTNSFFGGEPYDRSGLSTLEVRYPETAYMIKRTLQAASFIDELPPLGNRQVL